MESKITRFFFIVFCAGVFVAGAGLSLGAPEETMVRVAVLKDVESFDLSIRGKYQIVDPQTGKTIDNGRRRGRCTVTATSDGIALGGYRYAARQMRILAKKDTAIYSGGKKLRYRDRIDILRTPANKLTVVNTLDLESYLKGVLYHEVPHRWPLDAIEAQAVAARTYALYQVQENKKQPYDVTSGIYSQVYGGRNAERYRTNIAAKRTRGQILTYRGKILPAYFHSNCGGHTENVSELWKHDLPPLKGVVCRFCTGAPNYQWKKNFRSKDVEEKLKEQGYRTGVIKEIAVLDRTQSGRIKNLRITARDGKMTTISGIKFRDIIGPNVIKSNLYDIEMQGYYFDLRGRGWGHGVGMCQWGAYGMARKRYTYQEILKHYYPGAEITKIAEP